MNNRLVSTFCGCAFIVAGSGFAFAADMAVKMPVKAPPPPPAPVYTWTGWYVGGNVGGSWGTADNSLSILQPQGFGDRVFGLSGTDSDRLRGVIGGVQAGYNWQTANFLLGIETDFQGSSQKGSSAYSSTIDVVVGSPASGPNPVSVTDSSRVNWFGTLRGRLGLTSDRWLLYATGGLAYGEVKQSGSALPPINLPGINTNAPFVWDHSTTKVGWTIGAGVENAISVNWSWKIEYLYIDLGSVTANASGGLGNFGGVPGNCYGPLGGPVCSAAFGVPQGGVTSKFTDNIVRVGLNYQFH